MDRLPIDDADRDRVIASLQRSHASGYLDQAGLNRRVEVALRTDDPQELGDLVADLPDLAGRTWAPGPGQQLAPYQAAEQAARPYQPIAEPVWRQFLRNSWSSVAIGLVVAMILLVVLSQSSGSLFWLFWIFIIFIRPAMRTRQQRHQPPTTQRYQPQQQPPRIADRYTSEGGEDDDNGQPGGGQWSQPPGNR